MSNLTQLALDGNNLTTLPDTIGQLENLAGFGLDRNPFPEPIIDIINQNLSPKETILAILDVQTPLQEKLNRKAMKIADYESRILREYVKTERERKRDLAVYETESSYIQSLHRESDRLTAIAVDLAFQPCPKCGVMVEKGEACLHMRHDCGKQWWWCCKRDYRDIHNMYLCPNNPTLTNDRRNQQRLDAVRESKEALRVYLNAKREVLQIPDQPTTTVRCNNEDDVEICTFCDTGLNHPSEMISDENIELTTDSNIKKHMREVLDEEERQSRLAGCEYQIEKLQCGHEYHRTCLQYSRKTTAVEDRKCPQCLRQFRFTNTCIIV